MFPNIPQGIFNSPYFQGLAGANASPKYSTVNPFRTVDKIGQYGGGLNSSASQLYNHFRRGGMAADHGLPYGRDVQTLESFTQRFNPQPIQPPEMNIPPPKAPTSGGYQGVIPNFNFGGFNPANGIFNMQPMQPMQQQMQQPQAGQPQQMNRPMVMPSGGPNMGMPPTEPPPGIAVTPMPQWGGAGGQRGFENYKATGQLPNAGGIFNMPQLNRR